MKDFQISLQKPWRGVRKSPRRAMRKAREPKGELNWPERVKGAGPGIFYNDILKSLGLLGFLLAFLPICRKCLRMGQEKAHLTVV